MEYGRGEVIHFERVRRENGSYRLMFHGHLPDGLRVSYEIEVSSKTSRAFAAVPLGEPVSLSKLFCEWARSHQLQKHGIRVLRPFKSYGYDFYDPCKPVVGSLLR